MIATPAEPIMDAEPPEPARADDVPEEPRDVARAKRGPSTFALVAIVLVAVVLGGAIWLVAANGSGGDPDPQVVTVPAGTGEEVAASNDFALVGSVIRLEPGQELVLENDDVRLHGLGPLSAAPDETVRQTFATEGRYVGSTSLRSDGRVTILVENTD